MTKNTPENQPVLHTARNERDPRFRQQRVVPTWELLPNAAQLEAQRYEKHVERLTYEGFDLRDYRKAPRRASVMAANRNFIPGGGD